MENDLVSSKRTRISSRVVKRTKKFEFEETASEKSVYRPCEKSSCTEQHPRCCLQLAGNCSKDGYTSRWYHMSLGEHYCNDCFDHFYRPQKDGFPIFDDWCTKWYRSSKRRPSIRRFIADEALPYWIQCTSPQCRKWREIRYINNVTPDYIRKFECHQAFPKSQVHPCTMEEMHFAAGVLKPGWMEFLSELPLLKHSPAAPYFKQQSDLENMGLYPVDADVSQYTAETKIEVFDCDCDNFSITRYSPAEMSCDEICFMPESVITSSLYLALRNTIIAVWYLNPCRWLTTEDVVPYIICRGLVRIWLLSQLDRIVSFLTRDGVINFGILSPYSRPNPADGAKESVIVVGAGVSGIAAARHLHNLGVKVTVLESCSRIGGRIFDDQGFFQGAQFLFGVKNHPFSVISRQTKSQLRIIPFKVVFNDEGGRVAKAIIDRMYFQFSGIMDGALEWAQEQRRDDNWYDTILRNQEDFHQYASFTDDEDLMFRLMFRLYEVDWRTNLKQLTLFNYECPKVCGEEGYLEEGLYVQLQKLAQPLDIHFSTKVTAIKKVGHVLEVSTNKEVYEASRVLITVPLPVLRKGEIEFDPPLPEYKIKAFNDLGDVIYEKIFMVFESEFWTDALDPGVSKFAILSADEVPFSYFLDLKRLSMTDKPVLMTFITSWNIDVVKGKCNSEIIELCLSSLTKIFDKYNTKVPKPVQSLVTNWMSDPNFQSAGSFVRVGASSSAFDHMAKEVEDSIFFAGEATFRLIPGTVSGAYFSGLREANKIANLVLPPV